MKRLLYIICLFFPIIAFSQESKWYITIGESNKNEWPSDIIEMYDKGYLLSGGIEIENNCGLHAKLSINGSILFDKMLTHNHANMTIMSIGENPDGELISCGAVFYDNNTWPFLIKYDSCGERIWCKHFPGEIQETNGVAWDIEFSNDGNILLLASYYSWDIESSRIYLICIDPNGTELWKQPYATKDNCPWMEDPYGWDLIMNDEDYYIAGECYYPYPNDTNHVYLRPLFIGIDSVFHEKWVVPFYAMDSIYGWAESMVPLNDSVIMSAGIRLGSNGEEANSLLMFFNSNGKEVGYNQITNEQIGPDIVANWIHELERINDTLFIAASIFGPNSGVNSIGELVFDTAANLYNFIEVSR